MSESTSKSTDASIAVAAHPSQDAVAAPTETKAHDAKPGKSDQSFLHSPPDSNNTAKSDASDSELSDLEDEPILSDAPQPAPASDNGDTHNDACDDIGEVLPDHWSGTVPVFKPTMHQFKDFKRFMEAVDSYGMKSGIIKIIPPEEWKDSLPKLDELVKQVKVREPIKQDIMGSNGTYRQVNIVHGRSYNLPQWRQLCDQSEHQPPARRGERRANAEKPKPRTRAAAAAAASNTADSATPKKRGRGRPAKRGARGKRAKEEPEADDDRPMTPVSPKQEATETQEPPIQSIEKDPGVEDDEDYEPTVGRMGSRQAKTKTQTVSARRKYSRREGSAMIDEAAFKDWDYKMDISEYTPERCEELERVYWKTLTYAPPLYGADLMGTLFDESTEMWNLNKLPNLLDVLGTKVPGVNTAYLYLGMWKATFAWHLEDVDLYSINYLHFGAPKQWYSISQADARRFEAAMKNIWPADAKACDQFLRHKGFLISPQHLKSHYNITVNKCVSYPGEFVVTYPYGYHSGYNLGYNCAEAVNFALDSWLDIGKIAKNEKLRGEETEYEETEDEEDEEDDDDERSGLPTPPSGSGVKFKETGRKRKRGPGEKGGKVKKIRLRLRTKAEPPCCLCPNEVPTAELLPTDDGRKAHRTCALYLPETYIDTVDGQEIVANVAGIHKDRLDLKCLYCRSRRGACFQCSQKKCARAYHPTCAAAAGVFIEEQDVPVFGEDGTEYKEQAFGFSCRFHRTKRDKKLDGDALETDSRIQAAAAKLRKGDTCQLQYFKGEIFAGVIVETRPEEQTLLLDILPNGDRIEVEWKWLLLPDPADYRLPKASAKAIPMPTSQKDKEKLKTKRLSDNKPQKDDPFVEGYTWADFQVHPVSNKFQVKIDFSKPDQLWHYLGKTSTEARAQYTDDPANPRHNLKSNYLDTLPKEPKPVKPPKVIPANVPRYTYAPPTSFGGPYPAVRPAPPVSARPEKPYVYKPRKPVDANFASAAGSFTTQRFTPAAPAPAPPQQPPTVYHHYSYTQPQGRQAPAPYSAQRFEVKTPQSFANGGQSSGPSRPPAQPQYHQWQQPAAPRPAPPSHAPPSHAPAPTPAPAPAPTPAPVTQQQANHGYPRPQLKPSWQVHTSIYHKYPFFQVNHNRDSTKYKTPYAAWGGFTNGYEGNLRAHIMANKDTFLHHNSPYGQQPAAPVRKPAPPQASPSSASGQNPFSKPPVSKPVAAAPPILGILPRPAIKAQYLPGAQTRPQAAPPAQAVQPSQTVRHPQPAQHRQAVQYPQAVQPPQAIQPPQTVRPPQAVQPQPTVQPAQAAHSPNQSSRPKMAPPAKPYKIPPKESPVPLPANFLAAMSSTQSSPPAGPTQKSPKGSVTTKQTPVPIPQLPGIPPVASQQHPGVPRQAILDQSPRGPRKTPTGASTRQSARLAHTPTSTSPTSAQAHKQAPAHPVQAAQRTLTESAQKESNVPSKTGPYEPQGFPDVPGCESMEFVERLMSNLRKVSQRGTMD
ncbi:hypothetical protein CEP52_006065 [Fusarium oligoseptatum]|uniref:[histone H3]-trimethyl-L-lysine(9) demethylase n=1 Tax=Fusarium oligoseptatum TaxID=2604345 RepID=A0A428TUN2_9HYPO|nr:hypothetical protein CEP52_006065 [Fusarium oligoseptatum]